MRAGKPPRGGKQQRAGDDGPAGSQRNQRKDGDRRPNEDGSRQAQVCSTLEDQRLPALTAPRCHRPRQNCENAICGHIGANSNTSEARVADGSARTPKPNRTAAMPRRPIAHQFRASPALIPADRGSPAWGPAICSVIVRRDRGTMGGAGVQRTIRSGEHLFHVIRCAVSPWRFSPACAHCLEGCKGFQSPGHPARMPD